MPLKDTIETEYKNALKAKDKNLQKKNCFFTIL